MSKICPHCGSEVPDNSRFCLVCGSQFIPQEDDGYDSPPPDLPVSDQQGNASSPLEVYNGPNTVSYNNRPESKKGFPVVTVIVVIAIVAIAAIVAGSWYYIKVWSQRTTYLRTEKSLIESARPGTSGKIVCHSDGAVFNLAYTPDWVTASFKDSTLIYLVKENVTKAERADSIVIVNGDMRAKILVRQKAEATYLSVDKTSLSFDRYGGNQTVRVSTDGANTYVNCSIPGISATYNGGNIIVNAAPNQNSPRTGYIEVRSDVQVANIYVVQQGCDRIADLAKSYRNIVFRIENTNYGGNQAYFALYFSSVDCKCGRAVQFCYNGGYSYTAKEAFDYQIRDNILYLSNGYIIGGWGGAVGSRQFSIDGFIHNQSDFFMGYTSNLSGLTFRYVPGMTAPTWQDPNIVGNIQN